MTLDVTDEMVGTAYARYWQGGDFNEQQSMRASLEAALAHLPPDPEKEVLRKRVEELEAEVADAKAANERTRSQVVGHINELVHSMKSHEWLMEGGRGPYEWNDERYQDEFRAASTTLTEGLQPLVTIGKDWSDCPTDWDAVRASRLSVETLTAELAEALAQLAEVKGALEALDEAAGGFLQTTNLISREIDGDGVTEGAHMAMANASNILVKGIVNARKALQSTTSLAEHDAKVRSQALEEAAKIAHDFRQHKMGDLYNLATEDIAAAIRAHSLKEGSEDG